MYAYLEGQIAELNPAYAVIDCNGVGYEVNISLNTFSSIKDKERVRLYTHLVVRDDAQMLYGFAEESERTLFRHLITVTGIGPSTARMILSSMTPVELISAIASGNEEILKRVKGIGTKTAQRILIELKDKVGKVTTSQGSLPVLGNRNLEEALSGLVILGFSKTLVQRALEKIVSTRGDSISVEEMIKEALKVL
ncbi:MAG TPA: Holliday junction branch migration protein RuvA [Bacteroidales bacterium]|jgi:Holliday junction DNA helicase RuvA|nr:Holliday junction branch migration protein RuvA [Bacteroidales bacterium]MDI9573900.1 Holliday junction branch migration protein RuvA [Bacteroidota bacterium]OQC58972.1 MAG: Holliday junction ATP-dependent DNA helicase RuvA [Bacteroidetes bacterium ADurb.Bin012]MBP9511672.1 Holliday junction branch migration protein RuvA [Bacteroidales bacterium]MBP9587994.1 Holliday junction branch migration protein RuvA [Bacteroidales bacterium]